MRRVRVRKEGRQKRRWEGEVGGYGKETRGLAVAVVGRCGGGGGGGAK
jgi:hypothetical protein